MAIEIRLKRGELVDKALKRLKREMLDEGIIKELKDRQYYMKPSEKKRRKTNAARRRSKMESRTDKGII